MYASTYRSMRDHLDRVRLPTFARIGSAANDCGKRLLAVEWADPLQPQRLVTSLQSTIFSHPPGDQIEHGDWTEFSKPGACPAKHGMISLQCGLLFICMLCDSVSLGRGRS